MRKSKHALDISLMRSLSIMSERVNFDQYTKNYDQLLQEQTGFFSKDDDYFARYKVELAKACIKNPVKRILEYGCGIGRNIPFLKAAFPDADVVGSDISPASLEVAMKQQPDVQFFLEDDLAPRKSEFDLIFVAGVFHHIPPSQRGDAAMLLASRLTAHGEAIVFEHNPYNPVTRRIVSNCAYDADAVLLKPSELMALLSEAGLRGAAQGYCLFIPPSLNKLLWLEPKLKWLPLGGQYFVHAAK